MTSASGLNRQTSSSLLSAPTRSKVALKGSSRTVAEFFEYSINSILYQRGIYPPEDFQVVRKFDLNVLVTIDSDVKAYIKKIIVQLHRWLLHGKIKKLVVAIVSKNSGQAVELWQFDVNILPEPTLPSSGPAPPQAADPRPQEAVQREIQAIIRQITASITFLPVLDPGLYTFNVQVYADADAQVPTEWADSEARQLRNPEQVQLRSFNTGSHSVSTLVAYQLGGEDEDQ